MLNTFAVIKAPYRRYEMIKKHAAATTNHRAFTCSDGFIICATTASANAPIRANANIMMVDGFISRTIF